MIGAIHRCYLLDGGAHHAAGADGDDGRFFGPQGLFEQGRRALREARHIAGHGGIGRHHVAIAQAEQIRQALGQFHACGNGMLETEGNQPLRQAERHHPLRRGARDAQLLGDFILRVAGDVIEPAGPRRVVET